VPVRLARLLTHCISYPKFLGRRRGYGNKNYHLTRLTPLFCGQM